MKDLSKGNPLKVILQFALPLYIGQLFQLCYGVIDTRVVGSVLGEAALAAVGATTALSDLLIEFLNGVICGFGIVIATCFGAKEEKQIAPCPLVQGLKAVHNQQHRHHFAAFHHNLGDGLQAETPGVLHLAFEQHLHGMEV